MRLTDRETDTVLAALRWWQLRPEKMAGDGEHGPALTNEEIDTLIEEKVNVTEHKES